MNISILFNDNFIQMSLATLPAYTCRGQWLQRCIFTKTIEEEPFKFVNLKHIY